MTKPVVLATKAMCFLCFEALYNKVTSSHSDQVSKKVVIPNDPYRTPLFVTWEKAHNDELRGCIGNFGELPLWSGLMEYAVIAGTQDHRFRPIRESELSGLKVSVSLLHSFEDCNDVYDWELGTHGVWLHLDGTSATFLPQVAPENNWTKEETLQHLLRKAGWHGRWDETAQKRARMQRYQSSKISATWNEYQDYLKQSQ